MTYHPGAYTGFMAPVFSPSLGQDSKEGYIAAYHRNILEEVLKYIFEVWLLDTE